VAPKLDPIKFHTAGMFQFNALRRNVLFFYKED
jgi:hypothetical protein